MAWWAMLRPERAFLPFLRRDATWQAIQQRGTWRVGLDPSFPPFEMLDESGSPVGYDVALAQMLADSWGVRAEIVAVGFDSLPDTLKAGRIDSIVSAYPYDERLTQDFLFSTPYFDAGLRIGVRDGAMIRGMTDLSGRQIGVEWGSQGDMVGRRLQRDGMDLTVIPFDTPDALIAALVDAQSVDAILIDNVSLRQAQAAGVAINGVGAPLESIPYVIVMPRRAVELQEQLEASLQQLKSTGVLMALEEQWFSGNLNEEFSP
jgi:ABC-type amino acid transport substrate-binding protein